MGETISYNPEILQDVSTSFSTFDVDIDEAMRGLKGSATILRETFLGDEGEESDMLFGELNNALDAIKANSTSYNKVLNAKSEGFGNLKF